MCVLFPRVDGSTPPPKIKLGLLQRKTGKVSFWSSGGADTSQLQAQSVLWSHFQTHSPIPGFPLQSLCGSSNLTQFTHCQLACTPLQSREREIRPRYLFSPLSSCFWQLHDAPVVQLTFTINIIGAISATGTTVRCLHTVTAV